MVWIIRSVILGISFFIEEIRTLPVKTKIFHTQGSDFPREDLISLFSFLGKDTRKHFFEFSSRMDEIIREYDGDQRSIPIVMVTERV